MSAARQVVGQHGLAGSSIQMIADRAGISRPTVYRRWRNLEAVVVAAIADLEEELQPTLKDPPNGDLPMAAATAYQFLVTGPRAGFLRAVLETSTREPPTEAALQQSVLSPMTLYLEAAAAGVPQDDGGATAAEMARAVMDRLLLRMAQGQSDRDAGSIASTVTLIQTTYTGRSTSERAVEPT
ncbi:TetR/AcrR family transcriptional regulator [Miltoncostaea oceani]|uniref:TetR/AcrR family transcriptional regulator n=1 Tax=Miltoncostaea oceani TaxID=2843216 RepID=UPI001C3C83E3|nr:TetR/AcrR family transcriptional regulator [Miltoncostaea oceani]